MEERRHPTGAELDELYRRAKYLIDTQGAATPNTLRFNLVKEYENPYFCVELTLDQNNMLHIGDGVASCMRVNYENGGIIEVAGGSVLRVLGKIREIMILDDLARV